MTSSTPIQRLAWRCGLCVALLCALALSGCQSFWQSSLPRLQKSWGWYHDSVYPFDLPVPAGWQAFGYWTEITQGDHCYRTVDVIPTAEVPQYRSDPLRIFERISLSIPNQPANCKREIISTPPQWKLAGSTLLGGKTAALYMNVNNAGDFDARSVVASFGSHQYTLGFYDEKTTFEIPNPQFQQFDTSQLKIFDTVRVNFTYHG